MIEMGVGEHDRIEAGRGETERFSVQMLKRAGSLEQTAIDEQAPLPEGELEARAGDRVGGAVDRDGWSDHAAAAAWLPLRRMRMSER